MAIIKTKIAVDILKNLDIETKDFIKKWHYSKKASRLTTHIFKLKYKGKLVGIAQYGTPVGKYCQNYSRSGGRVVELKRLCLIDKTPKNMESFFISKTIKQLKKDKSIDSIISYADPEHGHSGVIYRASNFKYIGKQRAKGTSFIYKGKQYHARTVYNKSMKNNEVRDAYFKGKAKLIKLKKKHIYQYFLK